jgi:acetyltransferase
MEKLQDHPFHIFMNPRSVAVIGASRKTGKGSFNVIEVMRQFGFGGRIYPVNPFAEEIAGIPCHREVEEIGDAVDLAVVATPREQVLDVLRASARAGVRGAVVVTQGFADADPEGGSLQALAAGIARDTGMRILGPNTLGVLDAFTGFTTSFMPLSREPAPVAVICQSGVFFVGAAVFTGMLGKGIDIGNGCDLDCADALEYFGRDDQVKVIFLHIEGLRQGKRFHQVAARVARVKPVIALKTGRSALGARAAASHSGSMAGQHALYEAAFRQSGILSVEDQEAVSDFTKGFIHCGPMRGNRVGVITFTGGGGIIAADMIEKFGLQVAPLSPGTTGAIKDLSPPWMPIGNPLDIWPALMKHGMNHIYEAALRAVLQDPGVDGVICIAIAPNLPDDDFLNATEVIRETAVALPGKPVVAWLYGPNQDAVSKSIEAGGRVLAFPSLSRAARTLGALYRRSAFLGGVAPPA